MEVIDLKSREVFGHEGRGVAVLVEDPSLTIRQVGLEPGKDVPVHTTDASLTIQVIRGEGSFSSGTETVLIGLGKLLRIPEGVSMRIRNESTEPLVFLVIKTAEPAGREQDPSMDGKPGTFVNLVDFASLKPGKEDAFRQWFQQSSNVYARHPGFISRTLLGPIEGSSRYAAIVEHESKESFMDMHLSDDHKKLFLQAEPLILGPSTPRFFETLLSYRKDDA